MVRVQVMGHLHQQIYKQHAKIHMFMMKVAKNVFAQKQLHLMTVKAVLAVIYLNIGI